MSKPSHLRFYGSLFLVWLLGLFLVWSGNGGEKTEGDVLWQPGQCVIKSVTGAPCPGCGTTRSIVSIIEGRWGDALWYNPVGLLAVGLMAVIPVWVLLDLFTRKKSLMVIYSRAELFLKQPKAYIPLIVLVVLNWIWNIIKGL